MKKLAALLLSAVTLTPLALPSASPALAGEKPLRLTMSSQYMDRHPVVQKVYLPWIADMKKRTNGKVLITYYNPNTLCPDGELLDAVIKGQVDIGEHLTSRNPGRLPLNTVTNKIPMISSQAMAGSLAYWDLLKSTPELQAEYKGLHLLGAHTTSPIQVHTKDKFVTNINDIKDKRFIGASKDSMLVINGLGLNGLMQPSPDVYLAMSRNMGDAVLFPVPPMRSFKVNEATKYTTNMDGYTGACWMGMNQTKWDSLPPEVKKAFEETTDDVITRAIGAALDQGEVDDIAFLKAEGHEFADLPVEEKVRWNAILEPILKDAWYKEIDHSGLADPDALFKKAKDTMIRYEAEYGRAAVAAKATK